MKLYLLLPLFSLPFAMMTSCGDSESEGDATSETKVTVRANLPLYYDIQNVSATTAAQTIRGETLDASQLAVEVILKEDLYKRGAMTESLKVQIDSLPSARGVFGGFRTDKTFLEKVASKGETKTLYGEMLTRELPDGKLSVEQFRIKDASGAPMSTFNASEVIVQGSDAEKAYVNEVIANHTAKIKAEEDKQMKLAEEKQQKEDAEKARLASIEEQKNVELAKKKEEILAVFKQGSSYEGVYKLKSGEVVTVEIVTFDTQFLHGTFKITSKEHDFNTLVKFSFEEKVTRDREKRKYYEISGKNEPIDKTKSNLRSVSSLANNAYYRYLNLKSFAADDHSITVGFGNYGTLLLKR